MSAPHEPQRKKRGGGPRSRGEPTFVTPLTVYDFGPSDPAAKKTRQPRPGDHDALEGRRNGSTSSLSTSSRARGGSAASASSGDSLGGGGGGGGGGGHRAGSNKTTASSRSGVRQHSAAERRYRHNVTQAFEMLRQTLMQHHMLPTAGHDSDSSEAKIGKTAILAAAVQALDMLRHRFAGQERVMSTLEGRVWQARRALECAMGDGDDGDDDDDDDDEDDDDDSGQGDGSSLIDWNDNFTMGTGSVGRGSPTSDLDPASSRPMYWMADPIRT